MSVTDEIKTRIDIVNYVQRFVPSLKKAGRNYKACCPFHNEKTPSFVVNPERQTWRCFGACAEGGDLFTFAQKANGWDFREALRELGQEAGVQVRPQTAEQKSRSEHLDRLRGLLAAAAEHYHSHLLGAEGLGAFSYVRDKRGLTEDTIKRFQIGYAPNRWEGLLKMLRGLGYGEAEIIEAGLAIRSERGRVYDRFRQRMMIPIRDERGRVVGFGGRVLDPQDHPKYINSPQTPLFDKSRLLFGLDRARRAIRDTETVVIVEGYLDVIQAHQAGYRNVVAQMGTAMTEAQVRLVAPRHARKIVMALDADEAGQNATRRSLEVARQTLAKDFAGKLSVDVRILQIPAGKDPDDFLREFPTGWDALVDGAQPIADFVIDMETGRERAIEPYCLGLLMKHPNLLYQVNRKLRELAGDDEGLLAGPLSDLGVEDFAQSQYRVLMRHFQAAVAQDDMEPLDYVRGAIDRELEADFEGLLMDAPEAILVLMRGAFKRDLDDIFKKRRGRARDLRQELVVRALQLRLERLEQERIEMQYLQEEAQTGGDRDDVHHKLLNQKILLSMRAKARIDLEVSGLVGMEFRLRE